MVFVSYLYQTEIRHMREFPVLDGNPSSNMNSANVRATAHLIGHLSDPSKMVIIDTDCYDKCYTKHSSSMGVVES
jgi:hypothetical protein